MTDLPPVLDAEYVAIVGSRDFPNLARVIEYVQSLPEGTVVVSGGARGVDRCAEEAARQRGLECFIYPAEWEKYGKRAGFIRNEQIIRAADRVVAFWDGQSKGTAHSIGLAESLGKPVDVIYEPGH